jgi:hypothetical protein
MKILIGEIRQDSQSNVVHIALAFEGVRLNIP